VKIYELYKYNKNRTRGQEYSSSVFCKINAIATEIYGADGVDFLAPAKKVLDEVDNNSELRQYPICVAKTQSSLSDDPKLLGRPRNFRITIRDAKIMNGAGFIVVYSGTLMTMPGLPAHPAAEEIDVTDEGEIIGLF
jgi:formate--tetrahydrofolate ligase